MWYPTHTQRLSNFSSSSCCRSKVIFPDRQYTVSKFKREPRRSETKIVRITFSKFYRSAWVKVLSGLCISEVSRNHPFFAFLWPLATQELLARPLCLSSGSDIPGDLFTPTSSSVVIGFLPCHHLWECFVIGWTCSQITPDSAVLDP